MNQHREKRASSRQEKTLPRQSRRQESRRERERDGKSREEVAGGEGKLDCTQTDNSLSPLQKKPPKPSMNAPKSHFETFLSPLG